MVLSVLVPSIPERAEAAARLYAKLAEQSRDLPIEILVLLDNHKRSIGLKRDALLHLSLGDYITFVDDDDDVADNYITSIFPVAVTGEPDVISFDTLCSLPGMAPVIIRHSLSYENTQVGPDGATRKPFHIHPWRGSIARRFHFPDMMYGEDWAWIEQVLPQIGAEHQIEGPPLYHYRK